MDGHTYTEYYKSEIVELGNHTFIRIQINGDFPSDNEVEKHIHKNHPDKMKKYTMESVYHEPMWLTDWNVGEPSVDNGCFGLLVVFLKKK